MIMYLLFGIDQRISVTADKVFLNIPLFTLSLLPSQLVLHSVFENPITENNSYYLIRAFRV